MSEADKISNKPNEPTEEHFKAYSQIVKEAELNDIRLLDLKMNVRPEYFADPSKKGIASKVSRTFDGNFSNFYFDEEDLLATGQFDWTLVVKRGKKTLVSIDATYFVTYSNVPKVGHEAEEAFIKRVGKFATYPYFRALVAQLSWESKIDLPTLPVLK